MKRIFPSLAAVFIIVAIFCFFYVASYLKLTLALPEFDKVTIPIVNSFSAWVAGSVFTLSILYNLFQWLKKKAILSRNNTDNQVLTYLINFFSMQWFKDITEQNKK